MRIGQGNQKSKKLPQAWKAIRNKCDSCTKTGNRKIKHLKETKKTAENDRLLSVMQTVRHFKWIQNTRLQKASDLRVTARLPTISLCGLCESDSARINIVHVMNRGGIRMIRNGVFVVHNFRDGIYGRSWGHFDLPTLRLDGTWEIERVSFTENRT